MKQMKRAAPGMPCPHCGARAIVRTSAQETPLVREVRYRCDNDACGHIFVAQLAVVRTVVPSRCPDPDVHLPISPLHRCAGRRAHANDDVPQADNDDAPSRRARDTLNG